MCCLVKLSVVLLLVQLVALRVDANKKTVFCYWGTWSYYRPGNGKFQANNINPQLCTHIGYAFFGLSYDNTIQILDRWLDVDLKNIAKVVDLKQQNPNLKVLASVGGWNEGSSKYSAMAADANKRVTFVKSVVKFLSTYGFDGLDLDWEYPVQRGGSDADRQNYVILLQQLKDAFKPKNYLLTVAVAATAKSAGTSYDIPGVTRNVDLINLMTYDFGGAWDPVLSYNAPLHGPAANTVKAAVEYWLQQGATPNKLVLGIPLYGRTFTMRNAAQNIVGSPSSGPGTSGPFTREAGFLGYNEICADAAEWAQKWDAQHLVPYAFKGNQWVSYDNEQSVREKAMLAKSYNLAGAMVWSIETDDFRGDCGQAYPLLRTITQQLGEKEAVTSNDSTINTSTASDRSCVVPGTFGNPNDCTRFFICKNGFRHDFICPAELFFDETIKGCNWADAVTCQYLTATHRY